MKIILLSLLSWSLTSIAFAGPGDPVKRERPSDPWVYYSALDDSESMLAIALEKRLWVAIDTANCSVYKLWSGLGIISRVNKKYPVAEGIPFIFNEDGKSNWQIWQNGKPVEFSSRFIKHEIIEDRVWLTYEFTFGDSSKFTLMESPEYLARKKDNGNRFLCERIFKITGLPAATDVFLKVKGESLMYGSDIKTSGKFSNDYKTKYHYDWGSTYDFSGDLKLNTDKETILKVTYTVNPESEARGD